MCVCDIRVTMNENKMNLKKLLCSSLKVSCSSNFPRSKLKTTTTEAQSYFLMARSRNSALLRR